MAVKAERAGDGGGVRETPACTGVRETPAGTGVRRVRLGECNAKQEVRRRLRCCGAATAVGNVYRWVPQGELSREKREEKEESERREPAEEKRRRSG